MVNDQAQAELGILAPIDQSMHPYREQFPAVTRLPSTGRPRDEILEELAELRSLEETRWKQGYASGSVYHGDPAHTEFLNRAYGLHSQSNQLHADLFPSAAKFEGEVIAMTAQMLGADRTTAPYGSEEGVCGSVSSGGSESILLAIKTYRDYARDKRGITAPEIVVPTSAHAAFHKAGQYFQIKVNVTPLESDFRADVNAIESAINDNTIAIVGSAMNFPYGTIDPLEAMSQLALSRGVGLHVDGCLGGFFLPWAEKLGEPVPLFDFRLPGVTSISCDAHKYGYAPKGSSVVLYRGMELRRYQYFTMADWPGGLYYSPTFSGSRPGGLSAACWAALMSMGEQGYLDATKRILDAVGVMKRGIESIPELRLLGQTFGAFAFTADSLDPYQILDQLSYRQWMLTGLQHPAAIHLSPTQRHTQPGVAERFVDDLRQSVDYVRETPNIEGGMAPIYGMAAAVPDRTVVHDLLKQVMDVYYRL